MESNSSETAEITGISSKDHKSNKVNEYTNKQKLPLPNIKNLRKWINKDKQAS